MFEGLTPSEKKMFCEICCYFREFHRFPPFRKLREKLNYPSDYHVITKYKALIRKGYIEKYTDLSVTYYRFREDHVKIEFPKI